jgi:hypothetical protein
MFQKLGLKMNSGVVEIGDKVTVHVGPGLNGALYGATSTLHLVRADCVGSDDAYPSRKLNQVFVMQPQ